MGASVQTDDEYSVIIQSTINLEVGVPCVRAGAWVASTNGYRSNAPSCCEKATMPYRARSRAHCHPLAPSCRCIARAR